MSPVLGTVRAPVVIEIGGQRLRLNANTDSAHLEQLARTVNERFVALQHDTRSTIPATVLALVALQLADELQDTRRKLDELREESARAVASAESRAREVEQSARRAIVEAIAEVDRALLADDEALRKNAGASRETETETA